MYRWFVFICCKWTENKKKDKLVRDEFVLYVVQVRIICFSFCGKRGRQVSAIPQSE